MNFYAFLPKLLNMSLTGSVAIICVLLLRLLLKKAPKVISYCLWAVVLFRLLCPVSITSGLSLFGLLDAPSTTSAVIGTSSIEYVPENIVHTELPEVKIPISGVSETINSMLPQGQEQLVAEPLEAPVAIGTFVWLLGVLGMAVYSVIAYVRLKKKLLIASPLKDNIWLADEITTPFVMGLIRPRIYLPSDTEENQMPYLILHEKHHIRRGDHIFKALAFLALSIHWFNPLVWVAFVYANKDMEMSCDEAVVKELGDHILADYTASLLSLATGKTIIAGVPLAFGEGDTKGRIRNLAHWKKPAFWAVLMAVIACIVLGVGLLTNPEKENASVDNEDGYYLLIGAEGVESIEVATAYTSGGVENADGSAFRVGEKVWLEQLQGIIDLRGVTITALGAEGEIIYHISVPENATAEVVADIVGSDPWLLVPTTFEIPVDDEVEENVPSVVKWTFSPMMSATWHGAFCFEFELENYTHIEATCDNGKLWNLQTQGQPREKEMRFEQGEPLCWTPEIEGGSLIDTAESAKVTFNIFDGEEIVAKGVLDIVRTGAENGQSFYEAQLTDTELLALWQEEGSNSAHVIMAGNGAIVSYSDLNHNRINERVVVREVEPGMLYELLVVENGAVIWSVEVGLPHVGWNTIMLYNEDGKDYLVEYQPQMYQGVGNYKCMMYSLEKGKKNIEKEWAVDFELSFEETPAMETPEMEQFAKEVGVLLRNCSVLLSTENGILVNQYALATDLPQIYPVRFDPDEIGAAIDGTDIRKELTSNAASFPNEHLQESIQGETGEMKIGMVSEDVSVAGTPLEMAKQVVAKQFNEMKEFGYSNWRIDSLTEEYKYGPNEKQSLGDMLWVNVYRLESAFFVENPDEITLPENLTMDEDGWVKQEYPGPYLCVIADGGAVSYRVLTENDCEPGDEAFTEKLKQLLGVGPETAEDYYSMVTSASAKEVEQFAAGIKEDVLFKDWMSLSEKLVYPIQIGGKMIQSSKEFLDMDIDGMLSLEFVNAIDAETCREMFFNYQGIMMGATGQIWFASVDNGAGQWELKVIALNGLLGQASLERVMDRIAGQGLEYAIDYEKGKPEEQKDTLVKLCVSESGRFEAYGIISPEYGRRGILLNNIIDGEGNWNYFDSDWGYGKETPKIMEIADYKVQFSYYREDGSWCELIFDTYETGTMSVQVFTAG